MTETTVPSPEPGQPQERSLAGRVLLAALGVVLAVGTCIAMLAVWGWGPFGTTTQDDLRPFGTVPDFTLVERSGRQVRRDDLAGKVWIVDFIYTRCVDECPLASGRMARLQQVFADEEDVRLVSITVDPQHDTPEVLRAYAARFMAHPQRWWFLTGDKATIYRLAQEGFHLGVIDPNDANRSSAQPSFPFLKAVRRGLQFLEPAVAFAHHDRQTGDAVRQAVQHSPRLVLVDRQSRIRQYYDSRDEQLLHRIERHVRLLLRER